MLIYLLTNQINGKQYVGQTVQSLKKRMSGHQWSSSASQKNMAIAHAIQKYGWGNFKVRVLAECSTLEELNEKELYFVKELGTLSPHGYNLRAGGGGTGVMAEETRLKIKKSSQGRIVSEDTRKRLSIAHLGNRLTEETKDKLRQINKGKRASSQAYKAAAQRLAKTYRLVTPSGQVIVVTNLKEFCRVNNLPYISLHNVTTGRAVTYKGWCLPHPVPRPPVKQSRPGNTYVLVDPQGRAHTTNLLRSFCFVHELNYTAVFDVLAGRKKTHKGWTCLLPSPDEP